MADTDDMTDFGYDGDNEMDYTEEFKGKCLGVGLSPRNGDKDPHVMINILMEDDGVWFNQMCASSTWIDELLRQLNAAKAYMVSECSPDIIKKKQYGYKFKKSQLP